jgi:hypothetical protein
VRIPSFILWLGGIVACLAAAPDLFAAAPDSQSIRSSSAQFLVAGPRNVVPQLSLAPTNSDWVQLSPATLAVTCERVKQSLLRELSAPDVWLGRIFVVINPTLTNNQAAIIGVKAYSDGWQYQVELPRLMSGPKLVRGLVQVVLLEIANRKAVGRSTEIPLWLSEGLTQILLQAGPGELVAGAPQTTVNLVQMSLSTREGIRRDPLKTVRDRLGQHAALTFAHMCEVRSGELAEETWQTFQASAHLFVHELLQLSDGHLQVQNFLMLLPYYLNWQGAFLQAYQSHFATLLDAEKWWSVVLVRFTGLDPHNAWAPAVAMEKLVETLRPPVLLSGTGNDTTRRTKLSLQQIINEWDYLRQRGVVQGAVDQLRVLRLKMPVEYVPLVDDYRRALEDYLAKRDKAGAARSLPGHPETTADRLVRDVTRRLDDLDQRRAALTVPTRPADKAPARPAK